MKPFFSKPLFIFLSFLAAAFSAAGSYKSNSFNISPIAEKYLEEVLTLLEKESVNKYKIDWDTFRSETFRSARNSQTIQDTYPAVNYAVDMLKDNHSYFFPALQEEKDTGDDPLPELKDEKTPEDIGYIRIPFCMGNEQQTEHYITSITDKIQEQNNPKIKGWIIDLRDNFGGNMWPMMAAIGSFLDQGPQGYFFYADNNPEEWRFENGKVYSDTIMLAENKHIISLFGKNRIAVLINNGTASSGEATAVLLKGYSHVKLFGTPTYGVSTGCESFSLSDGSRINLATSVFADRNRKKYGEAIVPDFPCAGHTALSEAISWIYRQI